MSPIVRRFAGRRALTSLAHVANQARLSSHMSQSSWKSGGGSMKIEFDEDHDQAAGSLIRLSGNRSLPDGFRRRASRREVSAVRLYRLCAAGLRLGALAGADIWRTLRQVVCVGQMVRDTAEYVRQHSTDQVVCTSQS
jgi:hypothetical protein